MSEWGQAQSEETLESMRDAPQSSAAESTRASDAAHDAPDAKSGEVALSTRYLVPTIQRIGNRNIETTFLGNNAFDEPTWVLWTAEEPYLIGILRQGQLGYTFEQRTSQGVMLHKDISFRKVQNALTNGG